jgi:hypothetical protein
MITPPAAQLTHWQMEPSRQSYAGPLPANKPEQRQVTTDKTLIDGWAQLFATSFESTSPTEACAVYSAGGQRWQQASGNASVGYFSLSPAESTPAQPTLDDGARPQTWLVCGPFQVRPDERFMIHYTYRMANLTADQFFVGLSNDGRGFQGAITNGVSGDWFAQRLLVDGERGSRLWVAWAFRAIGKSESAGLSTAAVWLDDLQVWRYTPPATGCNPSPSGDKGVVLAPYDPTAPEPTPIIRAGETQVIARLTDASAHWVRLGIHAQHGGVNLQDYDRMVDTLCAHKIGVLGLLNQETLARQDYRRDDEATVSAYRSEFAGMAEFLAAYFAGRIAAWEVWNEPNLLEGAYLPPARYAQLLQRTYQGVKRANPQAAVIFGGLASAWDDSHAYLNAVYAELDANLQQARPFDHLAIHPYARKREGPDPSVYMLADRAAGYQTILDKFLQMMAEHGDGDKSIWVTEIGWNSASQSQNRPACFSPVLVHEGEQARYLTAMFDILFQDVALWGRPGEQAVAKVFWYQYMDVGASDPCRSVQSGVARLPIDWWFGLYRGDKVTPKLGWCAFVAYPHPCPEADLLR